MTALTDDFVSQLTAALADPTVAISAGKRNVAHNRQRRTITIARQDGSVQRSAAPARAPSRFQRLENVLVTLTAENEEALDALFDALVSAVFRTLDPQVTLGSYRFFGSSATDAGAERYRDPAIELDMQWRVLIMHTGPSQSAVFSVKNPTLVLDNPQA
jgi:hypothetical protein